MRSLVLLCLAKIALAAPPCAIEKGAFVERASPKSRYVVYLPKSLDEKRPAPLLVGLYGCGDRARNFAEWAIDPWATRATQDWIGLAVDGASRHGCWDLDKDADKVLAAVDDLARCANVDLERVVIGGYSSGGNLAWRVAMTHSDRFAGVLIENAALHRSLLKVSEWSRARRLPIAHRAHREDPVFPIAKVLTDEKRLKERGFPILLDVQPVDHSGSSEDWAQFLIPKMRDWKRP